MTKFFLPKQPGSHHQLHHKKRQPTNLNESIVNEIYKLVHAAHVKETLKIIKKLKSVTE
jgi:hypothetical protein